MFTTALFSLARRGKVTQASIDRQTDQDMVLCTQRILPSRIRGANTCDYTGERVGRTLLVKRSQNTQHGLCEYPGLRAVLREGSSTVRDDSKMVGAAGGSGRASNRDEGRAWEDEGSGEDGGDASHTSGDGLTGTEVSIKKLPSGAVLYVSSRVKSEKNVWCGAESEQSRSREQEKRRKRSAAAGRANRKPGGRPRDPPL